MAASNIGFVSTRFSGTDGVSLESSKWAQVLEKNGHRCFWFAGQLDRDLKTSYLSPEAHFQHAEIVWINEQVFGRRKRDAAVTDCVHALRVKLKAALYQFIDQFGIDLLVVQNALTIPMHIPLGIALTELISETGIPVIAHHHDFHWERDRYVVNAVNDYLQMAFPPIMPGVAHVVINSAARKDLALRHGIAAHVIPNVLDFDHPPTVNVLRSQQFKNSLGLLPDDIMILQPTRIIRRKGIEHTIELMMALKQKRYKLVLSHTGADEGYDYGNWLKSHAERTGVDLRMHEHKINSPWARRNGNGRKFSLWHIYPRANLVALPSLQEGFGNAFLEAVYFRKPILINRYQNFVRDIEPNGFDVIGIDGYVSPENVRQVKALLKSPQRIRQMTDHNYSIARKHYSYRVLDEHLVPLVEKMRRSQAADNEIQSAGPEHSRLEAVSGHRLDLPN